MSRFARLALLIGLVVVSPTGCVKKPQPGPAAESLKSDSPPPEDPTLTTDFFPQTGAERHLVRRQFGGGGGVREKAFCVSFGPDLETMWPAGQAGNPLTVKHRRNKDYLEYNRPDAKEWTRFVKLGAKPGDAWEHKYGAGTAQFAYRELARQNDKPCAVLEYTFVLAGKPRIKTTQWYLRGVGYVRDESSESDDRGAWAKQSEVLYSEWSDEAASRFDELTKRGQPTPPAEAGNPAPAAATIDAAEFLKQFHENDNAVVERYRGKEVTVTGALDGTLFPGIYGGPVLSFQGTKAQPGKVYFVFDGDQKLGTLNLKARQALIVGGTFAFSEKSKSGSVVVVCKRSTVTHIDGKAVPRK